ncbi:hypothetical protein SCHPADRAFT_936416 [Schizopora paradoxa]|uniref:Ubiquitin-like domain-containing protein n=1 Tax=Schizopora paradoxa TaxID=27342 RepID=A0A0H2SM42_9AGAM|nr:hypothetical protein SCHPADRAFT_936416 [Schizopora paradoxa]
MTSILRALKRKRLLSKSSDGGMLANGEHTTGCTPVKSCDRSSTSTLGVVKLSLAFGESAAEAVPLVGTPIKGVITALLKVLELFDARGKNKKHASRLTNKLRDLDERIERIQQDGKGNASPSHLNELAQRLENLQETLSRTSIDASSVIDSSSIADKLRECEENIDDFVMSYTLSATMNIENSIKDLLSRTTAFEENILQNFAHSNFRHATIHSPVRATIPFIDPRGKEVEVPLALCLSFHEFKQYIALYYRVGTSTPIRGGNYVEAGQYLLTSQGEDILASDDQAWSNVLNSGLPVEMHIIFYTYRYSPFSYALQDALHCFRCKAPLPRKSRIAEDRFNW